MTQRDFLVVRKQADGTLTAFIRNPEANSGARIGTRVLEVTGSSQAGSDLAVRTCWAR